MAQSITRMVPILRNQGGQVAGAWPLASWCDSVLLVANTNYPYLLKTDAASRTGSILRINCATAVNPLYVDAEKVAVVPTATTTTGTSAVLITCPIILVLPAGQTTLNLISTAGGIVTIEAFN